MDETGHKDNGKPDVDLVLPGQLYTLFKIDPHRSADVLIEVLGKEFDGVLGCDCFSAYRRYMRECDVAVQFCLAHLIRDVKFLTTLPGKAERAYGERLREALRDAVRGDPPARADAGRGSSSRRLEAARDEVLQAGDAGRAARPARRRRWRSGCRSTATSYFTFVTTPGVEPTNNLAEQAIRFVVIDRHITQGTRSERGQRWCERIWTVIATCAQQGRSVFEYLQAAVKAYFGDGAVPSLLAEGLRAARQARHRQTQGPRGREVQRWQASGNNARGLSRVRRWGGGGRTGCGPTPGAVAAGRAGLGTHHPLDGSMAPT